MTLEQYDLFDTLKCDGCEFITPAQKRSKFKIDERGAGIVTDVTSSRNIPPNF
jgi:hypothetical protein